MTEPTALTIAEARDALKAKTLSAGELTEAYISAIEAANGALNAYVAVTPDKARAMAKASDERIAKGEAGALEGIPLSIKDLFAYLWITDICIGLPPAVILALNFSPKRCASDGLGSTTARTARK